MFHGIDVCRLTRAGSTPDGFGLVSELDVIIHARDVFFPIITSRAVVGPWWETRAASTWLGSEEDSNCGEGQAGEPTFANLACQLRHPHSLEPEWASFPATERPAFSLQSKLAGEKPPLPAQQLPPLPGARDAGSAYAEPPSCVSAQLRCSLLRSRNLMREGLTAALSCFRLLLTNHRLGGDALPGALLLLGQRDHFLRSAFPPEARFSSLSGEVPAPARVPRPGAPAGPPLRGPSTLNNAPAPGAAVPAPPAGPRGPSPGRSGRRSGPPSQLTGSEYLAVLAEMRWASRRRRARRTAAFLRSKSPTHAPTLGPRQVEAGLSRLRLPEAPR